MGATREQLTSDRRGLMPVLELSLPIARTGSPRFGACCWHEADTTGWLESTHWRPDRNARMSESASYRMIELVHVDHEDVRSTGCFDSTGGNERLTGL